MLAKPAIESGAGDAVTALPRFFDLNYPAQLQSNRERDVVLIDLTFYQIERGIQISECTYLMDQMTLIDPQ
jgi:hypothetical protein